MGIRDDRQYDHTFNGTSYEVREVVVDVNLTLEVDATYQRVVVMLHTPNGRPKRVTLPVESFITTNW